VGSPSVGQTRRILLRAFRPQDAYALWDLHRDAGVTQFIMDGVPKNEREALSLILWLRGFMAEQAGLGIWHASLKDDQRFIGFFSLMPIAGRPGEIEIGARLGRQGWGKRLAIEGGEWLLHRGFTVAGLDRISALSHPDNRPVQYVLKRLGLSCAGSEVQYGHSALRYAIARGDWETRRAALLPAGVATQQSAYG
jgi:RimJ/RimL family protein N-acetyltransferase